ncbi:MAG TPA: cyclic nucleotide-binding domain-containing protein [Candidatus Limnocylindrales bacterium]
MTPASASPAQGALRAVLGNAGLRRIEAGGRVVSTVGPGDGLGEIALLRSGPRTATVTALTDGWVYVFDATAFRAAVAGPTSAAAAAAIIDERLARSAAG